MVVVSPSGLVLLLSVGLPDEHSLTILESACALWLLHPCWSSLEVLRRFFGSMIFLAAALATTPVTLWSPLIVGYFVGLVLAAAGAVGVSDSALGHSHLSPELYCGMSELLQSTPISWSSFSPLVCSQAIVGSAASYPWYRCARSVPRSDSEVCV